MSGEKHDQRQWFLRTSDKTVFGPVSTRGVVVWAEQGRILPGHEVSCDRKTWTPAEQVAELGICWYVDDGSGNLRGPLNRVAAEQILKSDKAPAGARLVEAKDVDPSRVVRPAEPVSAPEPASAPTRKDAPARATGDGADLARQLEDRDTRIARLKQTVEKLERELAAARNLPLLGVTPEISAAASEAAVQDKAALAALQQSLETATAAAQARERECGELRNALAEFRGSLEAAERRSATLAALQRSLKAATATAQARERECGELRNALAEFRGSQAGSAVQLAGREQEIARLKAAEAELLVFANTRDAELLGRVAELEGQLAAATRGAGRESLARAPEHDDLLRRVLAEEIDTLDKDLVRERETFTMIRDLSVQRQEALQARMQELTRLQRGDSTTPGTRVVRDSTRTLEPSRLQAELESLRTTHERETRQAEERENELTRRVRVLENEDVRLRGQLGEADKLGRQLHDLTETLRRREQDLGLEQKHRAVERDQYQTTEQALLRRIEELERAGGAPPPDKVETDAPLPQDSRNFRVMPWMRLRK
jgi:hypothetical protein